MVRGGSSPLGRTWKATEIVAFSRSRTASAFRSAVDMLSPLSGENRGPAGFGRETSRDINAGLPIGPATEVSAYPPCRKTRAVGGGSLRRQRAVAEGGKRLAAGAGSGGYGGGAVCSSGGIVGDSPRARWRRAAARANWRSMLRSDFEAPESARRRLPRRHTTAGRTTALGPSCRLCARTPGRLSQTAPDSCAHGRGNARRVW